MKEVVAPEAFNQDESTTIYLGGSINAGLAEDWQNKLIKEFKDRDNITFLNPRRKTWDVNQKRDLENPYYAEQLGWERDYQDDCDLNLFYFQPGLQSPTALIDFGIYANSECDMIVCCPDGYSHKAKIEDVCAELGVTFADTFEEFVELIKEYIDL